MHSHQATEEQLENLIENSPIAIIIANSEEKILSFNEAAHKLFGKNNDTYLRAPLSHYLPDLSTVASLYLDQSCVHRAVLQCKGYRNDNSMFVADVWFSIYPTSLGQCLCAMVIPTWEELDNQEESAFQYLLMGSRILVSAFAHETRNICLAIEIAQRNLARREDLRSNPDFLALKALVVTLKNIATMELCQITGHAVPLSLNAFFEELRLIIGPQLAESNIHANWMTPSEGIQVLADKQGLIQVFLNLIKNSRCALSGISTPSLIVKTHVETEHVLISIIDNGLGVTDPHLLFKPFQSNTHATGLGLYLSRALMRSFRGDLYYQPSSEGTIFTVELFRLPLNTKEGDK